MRANNGMLVIDDFGRQIVSPDVPAEPLDRAAGPPGGLPDPALRAQVPGAVRAGGRVRDQPRPERSGRRGFPAADPEQDFRGCGRRRCVRPHLRAAC
ncbi:MAG: hypothetical protein MZU91_07165 [Desulfosudis oleivorans]|nr:hypothetical protein [Desulfosudis oleivorans]